MRYGPCPAQAEALRNLRLDQAGAGSEPSPHNQLPQSLVCLRAAVVRG